MDNEPGSCVVEEARRAFSELDDFEAALRTDFRRVFQEDLGIFLPTGYRMVNGGDE